MNNKNIFSVIIVLFAALALNSCDKQSQAESKKAPATRVGENSFTFTGTVHEIKTALEVPVFPEHEGKNEFMANCAVCHSLKYISMQPDFPRKTWDAEVTKMVAKYKAPIDSVTSRKIVDYLVAIKTPATATK